MEHCNTLDQLTAGESAAVAGLTGPAHQQRRLLELGFTPGSIVTTLLESPWGDPVAYEVCGAVIALRRDGAQQIYMQQGHAPFTGSDTEPKEGIPCPYPVP